MKLANVIDNIGTITELKRIASAYVIDYRNLSDEELKSALTKTGPQYYFKENLRRTLNELFLSDNRNHRIISNQILKIVLLQKDDFLSPKKETEEEIINFESEIINRSNEDLLKKIPEKSSKLDLFKFVLETAWEYNDSISTDEKNLIEKIRTRLKITETEYQLIEAKLGKYPKPGNELHTRGDIEEVRRIMQAKGLVFAIRDNDKTEFDIIPEEIAHAIREILGIEIRRHGYRELLNLKYVRSKPYMFDILNKCGIYYDKSMTVEALQEILIEQVPPSILLGGTSPRDGLEHNILKKWCGDLKLSVSGTKNELISRIVQFYDNILEKEEVEGDEREVYYNHISKFAQRDLDFLRNQQLIQKDLECEQKFEDATNYLFEKKLLHKPLNLIGTSHADGALSYQDKIILWDNKSKESPVNLKDHIKQFDNYIRISEKKVACFMVIGPDFTSESALLAMQYQVGNGTIILLITAEELKTIADDWSLKNATRKKEDVFPLGYLLQPGRLNKELLAAIK